ncbi:hypothetical protein D3C75_135710 [compost metagenome]
MERFVEMDKYGCSGYTLWEDGTISCPNGKSITEPYATGQVTLKADNGRNKSFNFAKLVAENFVENPSGYKQVKHLDDNRMNCHAANLVWVKHRKRITQGEAHRRMADVYLEYAKGKTTSRIAAEMGLPYTTVKMMIDVFDAEVFQAP